MEWRPGWFDYPYNHRYQIEKEAPKQKRILMTSQNTELLGNEDWNELKDSSTLALQVSYIVVFEPEIITNPKGNHIDWMRSKKMSRWLFYDADLERKEIDKRQHGLSWTPMVADIARLKCKARPAHLPALPFDLKESAMRLQSNPMEHVEKAASTSVSSTQRRLAALEGDDWVTIKDKNWTPFAYKDQLLWSYSLEPHVVCENDIHLNEVGNEEEIDCVLCIAKYESSSSDVFGKFYSRIRANGYGKAVYYMENINAYLGVMHVIKTENFHDAVGRRMKNRIYEHYFYMTEPVPPFRIMQIASKPIPIKCSRCWSPWFEIDDIVVAEFVMYMQYHPDRLGEELVLSYGDGDRYSRVDSFALSEILAAFHE